MFAGTVHRYGAGQPDTVAKFDDETSGLGFLPDGRLLVVLKFSKRLMQVSPGGSARLYADLSSLPVRHLNDMVVDELGRAFVDANRYTPGQATPPTVVDSLAVVDTDAKCRLLSEGLLGPNGLALTPDGKTLVLAESRAGRISSLEIHADGSLGPRRTVATTGPVSPDGLCLDSEGGIWYAAPFARQFRRVTWSGSQTHAVDIPRGRLPLACVLGGPDRKLLYLCSATIDAASHTSQGGWIHCVQAPAAGIGRP